MNNDTSEYIPDGWGADELSTFLRMAHNNARASFVNDRDHYQHLTKINAAFHTLILGMVDPPALLPPFFLMRTHAAFMSAVGLALSGQLPECYMVLRGALESSLYAYLSFCDPSVDEKWMNRNEKEDARVFVVKNFAPSIIFPRLAKENEWLSSTAKELYEQTIDHGGHPNQLAIIGHLQEEETADGGVKWHLPYLTTEPRRRELAFLTCARVGVCCLMIYGTIFTDLCASMGLHSEFRRLSEGL